MPEGSTRRRGEEGGGGEEGGEGEKRRGRNRVKEVERCVRRWPEVWKEVVGLWISKNPTPGGGRGRSGVSEKRSSRVGERGRKSDVREAKMRHECYGIGGLDGVVCDEAGGDGPADGDFGEVTELEGPILGGILGGGGGGFVGWVVVVVVIFFGFLEPRTKKKGQISPRFTYSHTFPPRAPSAAPSPPKIQKKST